LANRFGGTPGGRGGSWSPWLWGRRAGTPGLITRRLQLCSAGYLAPLALGIVQFGFLMR
jgi:hypothetical protein